MQINWVLPLHIATLRSSKANVIILLATDQKKMWPGLWLDTDNSKVVQAPAYSAIQWRQHYVIIGISWSLDRHTEWLDQAKLRLERLAPCRGPTLGLTGQLWPVVSGVANPWYSGSVIDHQALCRFPSYWILLMWSSSLPVRHILSTSSGCCYWRCFQFMALFPWLERPLVDRTRMLHVQLIDPFLAYL